MEDKPYQVLSPQYETQNFAPAIQNIQMRNQILPPYDGAPCQMSPFGDDRWDLDVAENKRRKELHREYVYNYRKPKQNQHGYPEQPCVGLEEPERVVMSPRTNREPPPPPPAEIEQIPMEYVPEKKDYFKREPAIPKPKSLSELKFETLNPPNLYPVLKFPEKNYKQEPLCNIPRDIATFDKTGVIHYGVHVPFWQFSNKT